MFPFARAPATSWLGWAELEEVVLPADSLSIDTKNHSRMADCVCMVPQLSLRRPAQLATAGRNGYIKLWSTDDLSLQVSARVSAHGFPWITALCWAPTLRMLVAATYERILAVIDPSTLERVGALPKLGALPLCASVWQREGADLCAFGDDLGTVHVLTMRLDESEEKKHTDDRVRFAPLWKTSVHTDWVSRVRYIAELNMLCTASLDGKLALIDFERRAETRYLEGHAKGVYSFAWSPEHKFIASCGMDRSVLVWNPFSTKLLSTLRGHVSSVAEVLVNERHLQLLTIGTDKTVGVWDIRSQRRIQMLKDNRRYPPEDTFTAAMWDAHKTRLITVATRPYYRKVKEDTVEGTQPHRAPLVAALVNPEFALAVSGDEDGTICTSELATARVIVRWTDAHGPASETVKMSAMTFDDRVKRLITGDTVGIVKLWNFYSGTCLRELRTPDGEEISALTYVRGMRTNSHIVGCGWEKEIFFWDDDTSSNNRSALPARKLGGHTEDILCCALRGPLLVTGDYGGSVRCFNVVSVTPKAICAGPGGSIGGGSAEAGSVSSAGGGSAAAGGGDAAPGGDISMSNAHRAVEAMCFIGPKLLTVSADKARLWLAASGRLLAEGDARMTPDQGVTCAVFANGTLALADSAGCIATWVDISLEDDAISKASGAKSFLPPPTYRWEAHNPSSVRSLAFLFADETEGFGLPAGSAYLVSTGAESVKAWGIDGGHAGDIGETKFRLRDRSTWTDAAPKPGADDDAQASITGGEEHDENQQPPVAPGGANPFASGSIAPPPLRVPATSQRSSDSDVPLSPTLRRMTPMERCHSRPKPRAYHNAETRARVYTPSTSQHLNFASIRRPATTFFHLLHIQDIENTGTGRVPERKKGEKRPSRPFSAPVARGSSIGTRPGSAALGGRAVMAAPKPRAALRPQSAFPRTRAEKPW